MNTKTQQPFEEALPALLTQRGVSLRELSPQVGANPSFLSKALRRADGKRVSVDLIERVAAALGIPPDYFVEVRVDRIRRAVEDDAALRDRVYREVARRGV